MNGTPRVRSGGFPQTPGTVAPRQSRNDTPTQSPTPTQQRAPRPSLPPAPENRSAAAAGDRPPLIPLTVIDAPSQRFYAVAVYILLFAWRFWDWIGVVEEDTGSFALFMKWFAIDFVFLFVVLPAFRIPWLDLSQPVVITVFALQMALNWVLMFNLQVSWTAWLLGVVKLFYDKGELSISEHNVKVSSILHNSSLIMGKQIINILPEGSALLNPEKTPFCIGPGGRNVVLVPLYFNATVPAEVELIRIDLDTNNEEVIKLTKSQIREIDRQAKKITEEGAATSYRYDIPVKKAGAYRLSKVLDEYKLEVQRPTDATYVVPCPKAQVRRAESANRCINDLSNLSLDVHGTPPLKIVYSRTINGKDHGFHFQSLQPDGFSSPLLGTALTSPRALSEDVSWARAQSVAVALNESMNQAGQWQYSIDEVHDVFGNVVKYTSLGEDSETKPKPKHLVQDFLVRERPQATLRGCDLRNPLKVAKGQSTQLPVSFSLPGPASIRASYALTWHFSPIDTLSKSGDHGDVVEIGTFTAKNAKDQPTISAPGLYTLKSIACESCEGEIEEPSSCLLLNPLEPNLKLSSSEIPDKCAGSSIGLRVDLDLVGTPPFKVAYDVISDTERSHRESVVVRGLRQQIDLLPRNAGHYQYRFRSLEDAIYKNIPLPLTDEYRLEQNVKPPASAYFRDQPAAISACLDEPVKVGVALRGDGPFTLEWELVHDGRKKSEKVADISAESYTIETAPLSHGGDYTLALTSVMDKTGCRIFLKEETKITVRRQRPRAAFGVIENKKTTSVVEDAKVNIPLKLSGEAPWKVTYRNIDGSRGEQTMVARSNNDFLEVAERGTFEILDVSDKQCHGQVDPKMATFEVNWFARPELALVPTQSISAQGDVFVKQDVCEGDVDGFEVALKGSPPYHVSYEIKHKPKTGSGSIARREFDAAMPKASIPLDTSKAGHYTYKFSALADNLYNNDKRKFQPLTLEQTVNAKPTASFVKPGQIFKLCMSEQDYEEKIPITLQGVAPFSVEIEIRHHAGSIPETFRIPTIPSTSYGLQIPRQYLKLGAQTVRIREVRDARDCRQNIETGGSSVQVQLYDAPAIYPLETRNDYCVGERIAYTLSGTPPFEVQYTFAGSQKKAKSQTTNFRRIAEAPGDFSITSISDKASECRAAVNLSKTIHPMPSVRISRGKIVRVDIHEGSEVEILFEFWGTAPFEFTYTRSSNAKKGQRSQVLETRHDISYENTKVITASLEGTYEVVAIKDKFCAFSTMNTESKNKGSSQKMLTY